MISNDKHVRPGTIMIFGDSELAFGFIGRAGDGWHHRLIVAQLPGRPLLYGEWEPRFLANGNDFNVDILGFGYLDGHVVGSSLFLDRETFSTREQQKIADLIRRLFESPVTRNAGLPFSVQGAQFMGGVSFVPGWIRNE